MAKVGLMCGREFSFPPAFLARVNLLGKKDGVTAEFVKLGGTKMGEAAEFRVIVDRISHEVEYYRGYLKHATLEGTYVINNPFWWTADDKFLNYSVAAILKPFSGGGWKHVYKVNNKEELLAAYDGTRPYCMTLQQFINFDRYVRCFTFGKIDITPVAYDPKERRYLVEHNYLSAELGA